MLEQRDQIGLAVVVGVLVVTILLVRKYLQFKKRQFKQRIQERHMHPAQQDDVFTISGRLDQNQQWPTHDGRLSIHQLSMAELNKPPGYNDAPPSYEEAMRMAIDNSIETAREHHHQQQPESSSNQTTTTPATAATTTVTTPASTSVTIEVTGGS